MPLKGKGVKGNRESKGKGGSKGKGEVKRKRGG